MKKLNRLFLVVFSFCLVTVGQGQTVDQLIEFADKKFEQGNYALAAKEYQRALFFGPKQQVGALNVSTGDCYFALKAYGKAHEYYGFAANLIRKDSLRGEVLLKKASCQMMLLQYNMAVFDLYSLPANIPASTEKKRQFLLGVAYYGMADYERAASAFQLAIPGDEQKIQQIVEVFANKKINRPNPNLAYWMSVFIPGSGQFYSGDIKNGLNSFLLSAGLIIVAFEIASNQSWIDSLLTVFPWWQRYYTGGYNSARSIAEHKRAENRAELYRIIYEIVIEGD